MQWLGLLVSLGLAYLVALVGGQITMASLRSWYRRLRKPRWNPPDQLFGPVWGLLYTLMAIASWLVWRQGGFAAQSVPLKLYGLQLGLNLLWTMLFFGLRRPDWAVWEILVLWLAIAVTALSFGPVSLTAALLLVPYLLWVAFATALNLAIVRLNRP